MRATGRLVGLTPLRREARSIRMSCHIAIVYAMPCHAVPCHARIVATAEGCGPWTIIEPRKNRSDIYHRNNHPGPVAAGETFDKNREPIDGSGQRCPVRSCAHCVGR